MMVMSATAPTSNFPYGKLKIVAGFVLIQSINCFNVIFPVLTNVVYINGKAVSNPTIPNGAVSIPHAFSSS